MLSLKQTLVTMPRVRGQGLGEGAEMKKRTGLKNREDPQKEG